MTSLWTNLKASSLVLNMKAENLGDVCYISLVAVVFFLTCKENKINLVTILGQNHARDFLLPNHICQRKQVYL